MENIIANMSNKIERFEAAFNRIHHTLTRLVSRSNEHAPYREVLNRAKSRHKTVKIHYDSLVQFGHLRNAIVHQKIREGFYIAEPHEEVVEHIEHISELILNPPNALSIASQPVISFTPQSSLREILSTIDRVGYSQFPIYDEKGFVGLLTEGGIAKWLSRNITKTTISIDYVTAFDILPLEKEHNVHFMGRKNSIYDLEEIFDKSFENNKKLEAILITEHGKKTQKAIGIVTSWDLVQIDHTFVSLASQTLR
ncbi:CBS domain-containing protein [Chengkuizengella axinellae]|uniref:CBS domain-containing protein n=1 Tax=Chengkuizengella axinellae TaxID=3064388 RepID=A0ABT9J068_9BACL|nr:CBS domain-containing protein [Chengkuizengella sp. 2205SS18-9]MDP5274968.1 CBS domain-containing protein [Chengkuizengella sp. 2205SS18-9]